MFGDLALNTALTIEFKNLFKNTRLTNCKRVSTYLGRHQSNLNLLSHILKSLHSINKKHQDITTITSSDKFN